MRERERLRRSLSPSASRAPLGEQTDERGPEELAPHRVAVDVPRSPRRLVLVAIAYGLLGLTVVGVIVESALWNQREDERFTRTAVGQVVGPGVRDNEITVRFRDSSGREQDVRLVHGADAKNDRGLTV